MEEYKDTIVTQTYLRPLVNTWGKMNLSQPSLFLRIVMLCVLVHKCFLAISLF